MKRVQGLQRSPCENGAEPVWPDSGMYVHQNVPLKPPALKIGVPGNLERDENRLLFLPMFWKARTARRWSLWLFLSLLLQVLFPVHAVAGISNIKASTYCNSEQWNLKNGVYRNLYRSPLRFDVDKAYSKIANIDNTIQMINNVQDIIGALTSIQSAINIKDGEDIFFEAMDRAGMISGITGHENISIVMGIRLPQA